jgi:hypothetical protein
MQSVIGVQPSSPWLDLFGRHGVLRTQTTSMSTSDVKNQPTKEEEKKPRAQSLDERLCGPASSCRSVWSLWRRSHGDASEVRCECAEDSIGNNTPDAIRRAHALPDIPKKALSAAIPSRLTCLLTQPSKRTTDNLKPRLARHIHA